MHGFYDEEGQFRRTRVILLKDDYSAREIYEFSGDIMSLSHVRNKGTSMHFEYEN